jgi:hypothetical protein
MSSSYRIKRRRITADPTRPAQEIEWVGIGTLKPVPNNARTHSKRQIKLIARSIERFGFMNPVLIDGEHGIIAGHGRWAAAKLLGLKEVPTLRFEHLSDADKRAYILADNRIAEKAGWDREILAIELQAFVDMDFDIELTGFEMPEVELILDEASEIGQPPLSPEDIIPQALPGKLVVKLGDTWILGAHRLHCGDARDSNAYKALLQGSKAEGLQGGHDLQLVSPHFSRHAHLGKEYRA